MISSGLWNDSSLYIYVLVVGSFLITFTSCLMKCAEDSFTI